MAASIAAIPEGTYDAAGHEFYEGAEKSLELLFVDESAEFADVFDDSDDSDCVITDASVESDGSDEMLSGAPAPKKMKKKETRNVGLRRIPLERLEELLDLVHCTILHKSHHAYLDSYVLSESSMFVSSHRIFLKTCGQTSLLPAVPLILELAKTYAGLTEVQELFFSRKELGRPHEQPFPHNNFDHEVEYLNEHFSGSAHVFGRPEMGQQWFLYALNKPHNWTAHKEDQTLEILMTDLDPEAMALYYMAPEGETPKDVKKDVTQASGIADLFPGAHIDDFLFDPCGYSCNGILGEGYFTIHITPQSAFSYVSFETDIVLKDYTALVEAVLRLFRPKNFSTNMLMNNRSVVPSIIDAFDRKKLSRRYSQEESHVLQFEKYSVSYLEFAHQDVIECDEQLHC